MNKEIIIQLERDRKSVVQGKSVDLGGRRIIKKKKERDDEAQAERDINEDVSKVLRKASCTC